MMQKLALRIPWRRPDNRPLASQRTKASGSAVADVDAFSVLTGAGGG